MGSWKKSGEISVTLDNLNKVLAALQTSSPHLTIHHTWKDAAWVAFRAEAIKIVSDEMTELAATPEQVAGR